MEKTTSLRSKLPLRMFLTILGVQLFVAIAGTEDAFAASCRAAAYPIGSSSDYDHDRWVKGTEPGDLRFEFEGFTTVFDGSDNDDNDTSKPDVLFQPEWVAQEVHRYMEGGMFLYAAGFNRPSPWYEFRRFPGTPTGDGITSFELDPSYAGEGTVWNRGHMATRNLVNRISPEAGCNSHNFANSVPQFWSMNQGEWLALENYVGALANKYERSWHISGPVFIPGAEIEMIGGDGEVRIPIPHAVFKVIIFEVEDEIFVRSFLFYQPQYGQVKAIMAANDNKPPLMGFHLCRGTNQEDYDFKPYAASLKQIEDLTGLTFFPAAGPSLKNELDGYSARAIWKVDRQFFERPCGEESEE